MIIAPATLVTGNKRKIEEARASFAKYGLALDVTQVEIDEIQHHDPSKITEAKAKAVYGRLQRPILVNDSHWSIPALGGFPGGYMKDVTGWFTAEDFMALMKDRADRTILLSDTAAFYDGTEYKTFTHHWHGTFVTTPSSQPGASLDKVVRHVDSTMTLAEEHEKRDSGVAQELDMHYDLWLECAQWLKKHGS
jgi:XTP/dITP diphosphohydrolase